MKNVIRDEIIVKPRIENGKVLLDRNNIYHRYIMEDIMEEEYKKENEKGVNMDNLIKQIRKIIGDHWLS